jgi:hypothetical protein
MRLVRPLAVLLVFLSVVSTLTWAQTSTTTLRGTVTDPQSALIANATVTITNPATGYSRKVSTNDQGEYQFVQIPPGTYTLSVFAPGFAATKQEKLQLQVATPAQVNITLQVQAQATTVEITAEAPLVNTQDATVGNTFSNKQILSLPFEGRDPIGILSLQPGTSYVGSETARQQDTDSRGGSVNGGRSDQTNVVLDGVDNNDQTRGYAFRGVLRSTLDSVEEFRVTTTNSNADAGRSSGAQVNLVTKSGTNHFHGALYEFNRSGLGEANDWFNKQSQLQTGLHNRPPQLIRNTFGAAIGGPIKKDRVFFFATYEGQRTAESVQLTRTVPSDELRQGMIRYFCDPSDPNCTASNPKVTSTPDGLLTTLGPADILAMDPVVGQGVNPNMLPILQSYPGPNTDNAINSDGLNLRGFTFAAPNPARQNTYIVKLDFRLTQNGNHSLFLRGNLQNDHHTQDPQFPGQPPHLVDTDNSKGIGVGYTANLGNNKVNVFRYGLVRQGSSSRGINQEHHITLRFFDNPLSFTRSLIVNVPVHTFSDDLTWIRGRHTVQLGGNWRFITNNRNSDFASFSTAFTNQFWLDNGGIAGSGSSLDPGAFGFPAVDGNSQFGYDAGMMALAGIVSEVDTQFNTDKSGAILAEGQPLIRHFRSNEAEFYLQDSWRVTPNLTLTGGLRYSLLQPPYETTGNQVSPTPSTSEFFDQRLSHMLAGESFFPQFSFDLSGPANGRKPYWNWDYKNLAPRVAFAYAPQFEKSWLKALFGAPGKSSIRGGYGLYFDHFGMGVVDTFDRQGSFGLNTLITNPAARQDVDCAPRLTGLTTFPTGTFCGQNLSPTLSGSAFPSTPPADLFAIAWGLDDKMRTPYSHAFDFSITRELGKGFVFETAYVGRLGHHLLQQIDLAQPLDLVDPASNTDYYRAMTQLVVAAENGTPTSAVAPIPYWENLFPGAAGPGLTLDAAGCASGLPANPTATQNIYDLTNCFLHNETTTLTFLDGIGGPCFPACSVLGPNAFFHNQYSSLYSWATIGNSAYNAGQFTLRRKTGPLQFDFNYTLSKAIDIGSDTERNGFFDVPVGAGLSFFPDQIVNAWSPKQLRGRSSFDTRHNINTNWYYELPFGRGRKVDFSNRLLNSTLGGWVWTGVGRWTSGLPVSIAGGAGDFPTNWELTGNAFTTGAAFKSGQYIVDGSPNLFKDPSAAPNAFRYAHPGESGQRNNINGPGYFGFDMGLANEWHFTERQTLKFSWEVFNVTNSVRFDSGTANLTFDAPSFGQFTSTLTDKRKMQFALRYAF